MQDYQYEAVDDTTFQVRFLILLPGKKEAPIQGLLFRTCLTKETVPQYEALSYAWGSADDPVEIAIRSSDAKEVELLLRPVFGSSFIKPLRAMKVKVKSKLGSTRPSNPDTSSFGKLWVTPNLGRALPHLRLPDKPRMIWIDAICVNQENLPERSRQVQRMADIYQLASRVVVWLGEGSASRSLAFDELKSIRSHVYEDSETGELCPVSTDPYDAHWGSYDSPIELLHETFKSLTELFGLPWFHRLWIWQEIHLANPTSILVCGASEILWNDFRQATNALFSKGASLFPNDDGDEVTPDELKNENIRLATEYAAVRGYVRSLCELIVSAPSLETLIETTKGAQCTDPRDRVYALLSLVHNLDIQPDYTKSTEAVYQQAASHLIQNSKDLELLSLCELNPKRLNMPSWVPDFSIQKSASNIIFFGHIASCLGQPPRDEDTLQAEGLFIALIKSISAIDVATTIHEQAKMLATELNRLSSTINMEEPYRCGGKYSEAFVRTMVADQFSEQHFPARTGLPSTHDIDAILECIFKGQEDATNEPRSFSKYAARALNVVPGRSFYNSVEGYIGLCPSFAEAGDQVVFIVGCKIPLVLRAQSDGTYLVVGEAYCHGIMYGEPFLGPKTPGFDYVSALATRFPLYIDRQTGKTQIDDPRLGELPSGWSRLEHEGEKEYSLFSEEDTEDAFHSIFFDPRTTPRELRKRGVKLQDFNIT